MVNDWVQRYAHPQVVRRKHPPDECILGARMVLRGLVVLGYLLGSCPSGYWLVRLIQHEDIRKVGSGNIGATNVWRTSAAISVLRSSCSTC